MKKLKLTLLFSLIAVSIGFAIPPVANPDSASVPEGGSVSILDTEAISLLANDTDADEDPLTVNTTPVIGPIHGTLVLATSGEFTYNHDDSENFADSFTYEVSDGALTDTGTVFITITLVNDPPVAVVDIATVDEGGTINSVDVLANDTDAENDTLMVDTTTVSGPNHGSLTLRSDGSFDYDHDGSETTTDSFIYTVCDGNGGTATAMVTIAVAGVNDIPTADDDAISAVKGGTMTVLNGGATSLLANDTDAEGDTLTVTTTPVSGPSHGFLTLAADGHFTYAHDGSGFATDSFVYEISDGAATATATVEITNLSFPVFIPYLALEQAFRDELGILTDPLTVGDLRSLSFLDASSRGIADLTGLEAAINMEFLNLTGNLIEDLNPLRELTILSNLDLPRNQVIDLNPLSGLFSMVNLHLEGNRIVDIKPLGNLIGLEGIFLNGNNIFSINPLAGLTNPVEVHVEDNFLDLRGGSEALGIVDQLNNAGATSVVFEPQGDPFANLGFLDDLVDELDPGLWQFGTNSENPNLFDLVETPSGLSYVQFGQIDYPAEQLVTKQLNGSAPFESDWSAAVDVNLGNVDFTEIGERIGMEFTLLNSANASSLFHSANVLAVDDGFGNPVLEQRIDVGNFSIFGFQGFNGVDGLRRFVSGDYYTLYLFWIAESQTLVTAYEVNGVFSEAISSNLGSSWAMGPGDTFTLNLAGFTEAHTVVDPEILFFKHFQASGLNINPTGSVTVNFDPGTSDINNGMQWRVNGQDWQPNGATVFGINAGEALIEYRPVLGFDPLPPELIYVDENVDNVVDQPIYVSAGTFGALDPNYVLPEFKRESGALRVNSDGNGGLLVTWQNFHNVDNVRTGALVRVHESDGSLDENFNFGPKLRSTLATAVQPDGMILVSGGSGVALADGSTRNRILRVFPDGSRDFSFESPGI